MSRGFIPALGLIFVLLSIPLLILNPISFWVPFSMLLIIAGMIILAIPEIKARRRLSIASGVSGVGSSAKSGQIDACAMCGKPVAKGVAYCPECSAKLT